jgi:hypothetical protein
MNSRRNYDEDYDYPHPRRNHFNIQLFMIGLLCTLLLLGIGIIRFRPDLLLPSVTVDATTLPRPTLDTAQRSTSQQRAPSTAAEQQAIQQAQPAPDLSKPPALPVEATAAAVSQPSALDDVPARSLSPVDLTYRPVPTPTTMLSQEQFDASQASEEQQFIDNQLQGLTPAQQMVRVHAAEQAAQP